MPAPCLKELIKAANHAYGVIREPKEASKIRSIGTYAFSFVGYVDNSGEKKNSLGRLAGLEFEEPIEIQNQRYAAEIEKLESLSNNGFYFKCIFKILTVVRA